MLLAMQFWHLWQFLRHDLNSFPDELGTPFFIGAWIAAVASVTCLLAFAISAIKYKTLAARWWYLALPAIVVTATMLNIYLIPHVIVEHSQ